MTTNVFDSSSGSLVADSRWSQQYGRWLIYVDDTVYHKIEVAASTAFMFAGKGFRIQQWKDWIRSGAPKATLPIFDGICVCAVEMNTGLVKICEGMPINRDGAVFGGSGALYAYSCWSKNKDAIKSIDTAKGLDPATGGETRFFNVNTQLHNLDKTVFGESSIADVDRAILSRGNIMDIGAVKTGIPYKLSDLAANNDEVREIQGKIQNGELSADAPSAAMHNKWTDEQKDRVTKVLGEIFNW